MNILFLTPQLPYPPRQGTTIRNYNLIKQLAQRHTIDLLTFLAPGEELTAANPLHQICRRVAGVPQPMRSTAQRARDTLFSAYPDMGLRLESPAMRQQVAAWSADTDYALVQVEGIELAQYGMPVASHKAGRQPALIFDDHNCEYLLQQRSALTDLKRLRRWVAAGYSLVQWQKLRRYEANILRHADATAAVSPADRAALLALAPGVDIQVISNGIDLDLYQPRHTPIDTQTPSLVFTGKMDYRPNIDAALWFGRAVWPLVLAQEPQARFQIVGMNPHPRLDELRTQPTIEITGAVDDTRPFIHAALAYVIPMRVGGGTRFKALEAMACGKAIVSTTLGVEGIPVHNDQEMLIADTPVTFAQAVLRLIADARTDGALQRRLGANARRFVESTYSWDAIVPRFDQMYEKVVHPPPGHNQP